MFPHPSVSAGLGFSALGVGGLRPHAPDGAGGAAVRSVSSGSLSVRVVLFVSALYRFLLSVYFAFLFLDLEP